MERIGIDYSDARKYTNAFIEYLESTGDNLTMLENSLLDWLSDDDVGRFAEEYYDIEFYDIDEEEEEEE